MKKRLVSLLLVVIFTLSIACIPSMAQRETAIVIDGKRDSVYKDYYGLDSSYWQFFADQFNTTEPVDPERVSNTLWCAWSGEYIYFYFQCKSKDPLYQPKEGETVPPTHTNQFYEQVTIYLDTAPTRKYFAPCAFETAESSECSHFSCNAKEGEGKGYRLTARCAPAWDIWSNYYSSDAGVFFSFGEFYDIYCTPGSERYNEIFAKNPLNAYLQNNGVGEVASFIDYETNTYGFELKYRRAPGEEYFKVNIVTAANAKEWDEGWELGYTLSVCTSPWMNHYEMVECYYGDFQAYKPSEEDIALELENQRGKAVRELIDSFPETVTTEFKAKVEYCHGLYEILSPNEKKLVTNHDRLLKAEADLGELFNPPKEGEFSVYEVETMIAALPKIINKGSGATIEAARKAYDSLDPFYQGLVINYSLLEQAEELFANVSEVMYGDVTGDLKVDAKDALEVLKASVKKVALTSLQQAAAEVDGVVGINARDALEILKYAVRKSDKFPIEKSSETPTDVPSTN